MRIMAQKSTTPHERSALPPSVREVHKRYQKLPVADIDVDPNVLDFRHLSEYHSSSLKVVCGFQRSKLATIFQQFESGEAQCLEKGGLIENQSPAIEDTEIFIYEHEILPGLQFIPDLLPVTTQRTLLSRLWLRDLSNPEHNTNLHLHYSIPYPTSSFFHLKSPDTVLLQPRDPQVHKPLTVLQMLNKKLRWMTLGGQYDWTRKVYPEMDDRADRKQLVPFPTDIAWLINSIFPNLTPQAAISNLYRPGDTIAPHADVAEASSAPLASISIGIDAIFVIGLSSNTESGEGDRTMAIRLRSGDVLLMGGESRWAWHSVPKIISSNVDPLIENWPGGGDSSIGVNKVWDGWMKNRRVNLNVRQMWD